MWPTPEASDASGGRVAKEFGGQRPSGAKRAVSLGTAVAHRGATGGSLNPTWVEWLMGFPLGWTDCEDSATPSSPKSPNGSAAASSSTSYLPRGLDKCQGD